MIFNSLEFAIFLPLVFLAYWFIFNRSIQARNVFLLVISYIFYGWWDWRFLGLIVFSSVVDYWAGIRIASTTTLKTKKAFLWLSLGVNLGLLGLFKYFNFFMTSLAEGLSQLGIHADPFTLNVILPVGISFYTFQTMSYSIDVYRGQLAPTKDPIAFFAYVSFFPQLVAGPIERAVNLLPQFAVKHRFSYEQGAAGMRLILWGLFKKVVIADNCAIYVNQIFDNYQTASSLELILGAVLFAFQIYGDFSGYSDIAIGTAKLFGFDLMVNFRTPYFSRDIAEFWRRWHISLSTWFRDYVYIPLGGSRVSKGRAIFNTFVIFIVSGFWHGANWTFIVWGALNAIYFLPLLLRGKNRNNLDTVAEGKYLPNLKELFQLSLTFALTCIAWVFFRAENVSAAWGYLGGLFEGTVYLSQINLGRSILFLGFMLPVWMVLEWINRNDTLFSWVQQSIIVRGVYYIFLIMCMILFYSKPVGFIYFQF
ncbi:MBOAT family O-acyltransferase [Penaeicola halotolerans]|uniref:MBOAT family O-acyltransferase n=1 Tax=Penaeicola halotolerans TaxID=2793196 RepID=UPI001CF844A5|nr:MBOAT family O-acyltransferase [Penaeicola halotolerans]